VYGPRERWTQCMLQSCRTQFRSRARFRLVREDSQDDSISENHCPVLLDLETAIHTASQGDECLDCTSEGHYAAPRYIGRLNPTGMEENRVTGGRFASHTYTCCVQATRSLRGSDHLCWSTSKAIQINGIRCIDVFK
jgi:hypothetical protein